MKLYLQYAWAFAQIIIGVAMLVVAFQLSRHSHENGKENCWRCKQLQSEGRAP